MTDDRRRNTDLDRQWLLTGIGDSLLQSTHMDARFPVAAAFVATVGVLGALYLVSRSDGDTPTPPAATALTDATVATGTPAPRPTPIPVDFESHQDRGTVGVGWSPGPPPASVFSTWTGKNAVIFDTQTGETIDLGVGGQVTISEDGGHAAWVRGEWYTDAIGFPAVRGDAWIISLATREERRIGPAQVATFVAGDRIALQAPRTPLEDAKWQLYDIATLRLSADQTTEPPVEQSTRITSTGHVLIGAPVSGTELPRGGYGAATWRLLDPRDQQVVMEFEAFAVSDATVTELVVARAMDGFPSEAFRSVPVQLYILNVATGQAKWTGSAMASTPNWNLSANENYLLWTDNFCADDGAAIEVVLVDRATGAYRGYTGGGPGTSLRPGSNEAWMFLTPSGLIAQGTFGPTALLDPATGQYVAVLPTVELDPSIASSGPVQANWSADYRYATYYFAGGHGGLC